MPYPTSPLHLKPWQRSSRSQSDDYTQSQSRFEASFEPAHQIRNICAARSRFDLQAEFRHRFRGAHLNLVFSHARTGTHDFFNGTRINIDAAYHHHVIDTAQNPSFQSKVVTATQARFT